MRQQIDIADVEVATKIRAKYLRALENEEFALLPGNTFVKTFLRTYAEYLGLDPQLLLEEYRAGYEPRSDSELQPYSVAARRRPREGRQRRRAPAGPPGPGTAIIVLVVAVLVVFAILGLTSGGSDKGSSGNSGKTATTHKQHKKRPRPKPVARTVTLKAVPSVATYMCVDRGPGTTVVYQGTTSSPQHFHGKHLRINAGNDSVQMTVNHKPVHVPRSGLPIGYDFLLHSDGKVAVKPIPSGQRPCA
jgi:cytoskeleton protein RodZ